MAFDSKHALNTAIRYLTEAAHKRAAGGWVPPKEEERRKKEAAKSEEKQQKLLSKQFPTHYMPNVGRQVMASGGKTKKHPALSIAGTHIREETHGEPIFTGRL